MFKEWYWKIYALLNAKISEKIWRLKSKRAITYGRHYRVGDVYLDKKTKKTWRIIYRIQNLMGDYDLFIRDDKGRVRVVKDYNLDDDLFCSKIKKLIRCVDKDEDELDSATIERINNYFNKKHQKLVEANYDNAIIKADGNLLSRRRLKPCLKCGSTNVAEYLYGDDFDAIWLKYHLEKGDFLMADVCKNPEKHIFHCKECGADYNPFIR